MFWKDSMRFSLRKYNQLSVGKAAINALEKKNHKILEGVCTSDCLTRVLKFYFPFKENKTGNFRSYIMRMVCTK